MTATAPHSTPDTRPPVATWRAARLHRPLLVLAVVMLVGAAASVVGLAVDPREILGQPVWAKPLKFCLSIALYAVTLAWMIGLVPRRRRLVSAIGSVVVVALLLEMVVIVGAVVLGTTSHFNVSSPGATAAWGLMAVSIIVVWLATVVVAALLFRAPLGDPARTLAIRAGLVIGLIGMALAFLMTSPTAGQIDDFQGVAGAHAVGVADGGAGIPILGWSTEGGDLRVPHFVGMHALQVLPLLVIGLEWLALRVPVLRGVRVRFRLVLIGTAAFAGVVALTTWQALRGQSIVAPDAATLAVAIPLAIVAALAVVVVLVRGNGRSVAGGDPARPGAAEAPSAPAATLPTEAAR